MANVNHKTLNVSKQLFDNFKGQIDALNKMIMDAKSKGNRFEVGKVNSVYLNSLIDETIEWGNPKSKPNTHAIK